MADAYTPVDGLKNIVSFPTDPADEAAARKQIQDMFDQILGFHNAHSADTVANTAGVHGLKIEEGTFTPYFYGTSTAGTGLTYSTQSGKYYKIGKKIHVDIVLVLTSKGSDIDGYLRVGGLPFAVSGSSPSCSIGFVYNLGLSTGTMFGGWGSSTYIALNELGNNVGLNLNVDKLQNNSQIYISMDYLAGS